MTGGATRGDWPYRAPPDLEQFQKLAEAAYGSMPENFRRLCGNLVIHVADEADRAALREMGIEDPLTLSGLFEGVGLAHASVSDPYEFPNHVHLYRRSIIAEWRARGDVRLVQLITHVLVHEIGHHFGLSDEDMHMIENAAS